MRTHRQLSSKRPWKPGDKYYFNVKANAVIKQAAAQKDAKTLVDELLRRLMTIEEAVVKSSRFKPLAGHHWPEIRHNLTRRAKVVQQQEVILVSGYFEISPEGEIELDLVTTVVATPKVNP